MFLNMKKKIQRPKFEKKNYEQENVSLSIGNKNWKRHETEIGYLSFIETPFKNK